VKKLLAVLFVFISIYSFGQAYVGSDGSLHPVGSFPVAHSNEIKGGFKRVNTLSERDNIPMSLRDTGMLAYIVQDNETYQLRSGIDNNFWTKFANDGGNITYIYGDTVLNTYVTNYIDSIFNITNISDTTINNYISYIVDSIVGTTVMQGIEGVLRTNPYFSQNNRMELQPYRFSIMSGSTRSNVTSQIGALIDPYFNSFIVAPKLNIKLLRYGVTMTDNKASYPFQQAKSNGYDVFLTVNSVAVRQSDLSNYPTAADLPQFVTNFKQFLTNRVKGYADKISLENEENNSSYRPFWVAGDYINELSAITKVAHDSGYIITNGGLTGPVLRRWVWKWLNDHGRVTQANIFANQEINPAFINGLANWETNPTWSGRVAQFDSLIRAYDTIPIDYVNFHYYAPGFDTTTTWNPNCLLWITEALHDATGKTVITNETGVDNHDASLPTTLVSTLVNANMPYILYYSGDGQEAVALQDTSTVLRPAGVNLADYNVALAATDTVSKETFAIEKDDIYHTSKKKSYTQLMLLDTTGKVTYRDTTGLFGGSGGGATPNLQQVTNIGNTTTDSVTIGSNAAPNSKLDVISDTANYVSFFNTHIPGWTGMNGVEVMTSDPNYFGGHGAATTETFTSAGAGFNVGNWTADNALFSEFYNDLNTVQGFVNNEKSTSYFSLNNHADGVDEVELTSYMLASNGTRDSSAVLSMSNQRILLGSTDSINLYNTRATSDVLYLLFNNVDRLTNPYYGTTTPQPTRGFRDSSGIMQYKDATGNWTPFDSLAGSGGSQNLDQVLAVGHTSSRNATVGSLDIQTGGYLSLAPSAVMRATTDSFDIDHLTQINNSVGTVISPKPFTWKQGTGNPYKIILHPPSTMAGDLYIPLKVKVNGNTFASNSEGEINLGTLDSTTGGSSGSQDLQSVTNIGNTTTNYVGIGFESRAPLGILDVSDYGDNQHYRFGGNNLNGYPGVEFKTYTSSSYRNNMLMSMDSHDGFKVIQDDSVYDGQTYIQTYNDLNVLSSSMNTIASQGYSTIVNEPQQSYIMTVDNLVDKVMYFGIGYGAIKLTSDTIQFFNDGIAGETNSLDQTTVLFGNPNPTDFYYLGAHGIRDNLGHMEYKDIDGVWTGFAAGGTGGGSTPSLQEVTDEGNTTTNNVGIGDIGIPEGKLDVIGDNANRASIWKDNPQGGKMMEFVSGNPDNKDTSYLDFSGENGLRYQNWDYDAPGQRNNSSIFADRYGVSFSALTDTTYNSFYADGTNIIMRAEKDSNGNYLKSSGILLDVTHLIISPVDSINIVPYGELFHDHLNPDSDRVIAANKMQLLFGTYMDTHGFRDNNGTMQYKNAGGAWTNFSGGTGGGGGITSESDPLSILNQQAVKQNANSWYKKATLDSIHIGVSNGANTVPFQVDGTGWINAWQFATTGRMSYSGKQFVETPSDSTLYWGSHPYWKYINFGVSNSITKLKGTYKLGDIQSGLITDSVLVRRASDSTIRAISVNALLSNVGGITSESDPLSIHNQYSTTQAASFRIDTATASKIRIGKFDYANMGAFNMDSTASVRGFYMYGDNNIKGSAYSRSFNMGWSDTSNFYMSVNRGGSVLGKNLNLFSQDGINLNAYSINLTASNLVNINKLNVSTSFTSAVDMNFAGYIASNRTLGYDQRPNTSGGTFPDGAGISIVSQGAAQGGTNKNGGSTTISGGISTGVGTSTILFKTASAGISGTTDNTPTTKLTVTAKGDMQYSANYALSYTPRSLVDKNYVDSSLATVSAGGTAPTYTAGAGIAINSNVISNTITNNNQLTNGSNFITLNNLSVVSGKALSYNSATGVFDFDTSGYIRNKGIQSTVSLIGVTANSSFGVSKGRMDSMYAAYARNYNLTVDNNFFAQTGTINTFTVGQRQTFSGIIGSGTLLDMSNYLYASTAGSVLRGINFNAIEAGSSLGGSTIYGINSNYRFQTPGTNTFYAYTAGASGAGYPENYAKKVIGYEMGRIGVGIGTVGSHKFADTVIGFHALASDPINPVVYGMWQEGTLSINRFEGTTFQLPNVPVNSSGSYSVLVKDATGNVQTVASSSFSGGGTTYTPSYKVYSATFTQTGTNAPVVTVLENTLGVTITWTRVATGQYRATFSSGTFLNAKTAFLCPSTVYHTYTSDGLAHMDNIQMSIPASMFTTGDNYNGFEVQTHSADCADLVATDGISDNNGQPAPKITIEVRVYN
jgi:hypothetical protein